MHRFNHLNRKVHYWIGLAAALPLLVIVVTGLLLQTKKQWSWVQPVEQRGTGTEPAIGFPEILSALAAVPGMEVRSWDDVQRIDVRPDRGVAKAWLHNGWEVQIDLGSGRVLHSAYRRSDLIESLHDGSWFGGDWVKLGLFLPAGIVLFLLLVSGIWLWWIPFRARRLKAEKKRRSEA